MEDNPCLGRCSKCPTIALLSVCEHQTSADLIIKPQSFCYKVSAVAVDLAVDLRAEWTSKGKDCVGGQMS